MKNLSNLGKSLSKMEQKLIHGGGPSAADIAAGFPPECTSTGTYLMPGCNAEQSELASSGDTYWLCVCGTDAGVWDDFDGGGATRTHYPGGSGYPYGGIG